MTSPQPGWYTDPQNQSQVRFWNGERWTDQIRPAQYAMAPADQAPTYGAPAQSATAMGAAYPVYPTYAAPPTFRQPVPAARPNLWQSNRTSAIAAVFCAIYLVIAFSTHFVILGIAPLLLTIRAFRRQEPFAVGALVLTIITLVVSATALTR
jgi:hypothetical protein